MADKNIIGGLAEALANARLRLDTINAEISALESERQSISELPPHTDDVIAAFNRGIAASARTFEQRLGWFLNDANLREPGTARAVQREEGAGLLALPATRPGWKSFLPHNGLGLAADAVDLAAITYLLRDKIVLEVPAMVRKLCPAAENGLKQRDREAKLGVLDQQLAALHAERGELLGTLESARAAVAAVDEQDGEQ